MLHYSARVRFYTEESFYISLDFSFEAESTDNVFERFNEEVSSICTLKPVKYEMIYISCPTEVAF